MTEQNKIPVAEIQAIVPVKHKRIGFMEDPNFKLTDAFWEPLPKDELRLWNGEGE